MIEDDFVYPNPDPSTYVSNPPLPPNKEYLASRERRQGLAASEITATIIGPAVTITDIRPLINSCDYRGPIVSEGCQCTRLCWMGKGYNPDGLPYGKVKDYDCCKCVTEKN